MEETYFKNFKEELTEVWTDEKIRLAGIDREKDAKSWMAQMDRVTEVEKRLTDLTRTCIETEERAASSKMEEKLKMKQMECDEKDRQIKNRNEIIRIGVPTVAAFVMGVISMVWEKTDVLTSTAGKSALRDLFKFR